MVETGQPGKLPRLARAVFEVTEPDDARAALAGIAAFETWCTRIGSPIRISQLGIPGKALPAIVENAAGTAVAWGMAETYTPDVIRNIIERCF
jgi:alcohol dehydrogenase YqhD (iron-dependent ADH family)